MPSSRRPRSCRPGRTGRRSRPSSRRQRLGELRPGGGVVQRRLDRGHHDAGGGGARLAVLIELAAGDRGRPGLGHQAATNGAGRTDRAAGDQPDAVGGEGVEARLEALGAGLRVGFARSVGVDGGVEHQRPGLVREQLGVGGAEGGAVGVAQVGQLLVAEGLPQLVHVPRGVDRVERAEGVAVLVGAAVGDLLGEGEGVVELLGGWSAAARRRRAAPSCRRRCTRPASTGRRRAGRSRRCRSAAGPPAAG